MENNIINLLNQIQNEKWGYIYGASGQLWTAEKQAQLVSAQKNNPKYEMSIKYGDKWIGHHVTDCSGLVCYVWKKLFGTVVPHGSNSQEKLCKVVGYISNVELPIGTWVFKTRDGKDFYHVGLYMGDGVVLEARGARYGVVQSYLTSWQYYGIPTQLLTDGDETQKADDQPMKTAKVYTNGNGKLNVRRAPSGSVLDRIAENTVVDVLENDGTWAKVTYNKTITGYVMSKYLKT